MTNEHLAYDPIQTGKALFSRLRNDPTLQGQDRALAMEFLRRTVNGSDGLRQLGVTAAEFLKVMGSNFTPKRPVDDYIASIKKHEA